MQAGLYSLNAVEARMCWRTVLSCALAVLVLCSASVRAQDEPVLDDSDVLAELEGFTLPVDYLPDEDELPPGATMAPTMPRTILGQDIATVVHRFFVPVTGDPDAEALPVDLRVTVAEAPAAIDRLWQSTDRTWRELRYQPVPLTQALGQDVVLVRALRSFVGPRRTVVGLQTRVGAVHLLALWDDVGDVELLSSVLPLVRVTESHAWANPAPRLPPLPVLAQIPSVSADDPTAAARASERARAYAASGTSGGSGG
jgi:hypothetical protein